MILGHQIEEIIKEAMECQSYMTDGVVQYDYEDQKIFGACFTTGTIENPENPFIEVYRLPQGERGEIDMRCWESCDCPFSKEHDGIFDKDMTNEDGNTKEECCMMYFIEETDIEEEITEVVEEQVRTLLSEHLGGTIEKLNEIRIQISDRFEPWNYFNVRQDTWEMNVLDTYVDDAVENGFDLSISPNDWLDSEIQLLSNIRFENNDFLQKIGILIEDNQFDKALLMLKGGEEQ